MYNSIKRCIMKILEKINFRQPKYMLPAILYFPLLGTSYFIFDLFQTETIEIQDKALQTTEFLNPELPGAQIKDDGMGSKYENMAKSWGKIQDYSAVDNIDREEPDKNKEEYESKYTQDDIDLLTEEQQEKLRQRKLPLPRHENRKHLPNWKSTRRGETERAKRDCAPGRNGHGQHCSTTRSSSLRNHQRREPGCENAISGRTAQRGGTQGEDNLGLL